MSITQWSKTADISPLVEYAPVCTPGFAGTGALCPSVRLASKTTGCRSLIVIHTVHLKTFSSLGHRTIASHVIQFPVVNSLSGALACFVVPLYNCFTKAAEAPPSSTESAPTSLPFFVVFFPVKSDGNGWLIDLVCFDLGLEVNRGMPTALSRMSASVSGIEGRRLAGDGKLGPASFWLGSSLREVGESMRLAQVAIARLSIKQQLAHGLSNHRVD